MKRKLDRKEIRRISAVFIACIVLLLGCGGGSSKSDAAYSTGQYATAAGAYEEYDMWDAEVYAEETANAIDSYTGEGNSYRDDAVKQKLIQNIYATVRVQNP